MFLQETKVKASFSNFWKFIFGFYGCLAVDCEGRSGGLALLWKKLISLHILLYSKNDVHGFISNKDIEWFNFGIYDNPKASKRAETLKLLTLLRNREERPWLVLEDFNEIVHPSKKHGERCRPEPQMFSF